MAKLTLTIFAPASYADNICKSQIDGFKFSFKGKKLKYSKSQTEC